MPAQAQAPLSPEEARTLEYGKEIFKIKANCQFCHKWDASGDQGYGGDRTVAAQDRSSRPSRWPRWSNAAGPAPACRYHDQFAYTDKRCYGYTRAELGKDMPPAGNESLQPREIDAVVKYLFAKAVGRGPATYEDCVDFWGTDTRQCEPMKK